MTTPVRQGGDSERVSAGLEHDARWGSGRQEWPALIKLRPVLFKHEHGDSGAMAATGAATTAGSYRLALGRNETHIVESCSDLSSVFLQVEKPDIDPKTFNGRKVREESTDRSRTSSKVEFDAAQLRIVRVFSAGAMTCELREAVVPALVVDLRTGDVRWLTPSAGVNGNNHGNRFLRTTEPPSG